jgi:hypothetical protein
LLIITQIYGEDLRWIFRYKIGGEYKEIMDVDHLEKFFICMSLHCGRKYSTLQDLKKTLMESPEQTLRS